MKSIITGTGTYIPTVRQKNEDFLNAEFFNENHKKLPNSNEIILKKFKGITGIEERRYVSDDLVCSDIAIKAAQIAIEDAGIDPEELDYIILGHNFGDVRNGEHQGDTLPSIAGRVKHYLGIKNPNCVAYDIIFGCPGWLEGVIHSDAFIKSGLASKCLIIGSETLSRVVDPFDRDSLIYADGAGACILEKSNDSDKGILSTASQSHTLNEAFYLFFDNSYNPNERLDTRFIKMHGRKIYEFALNNVPIAMKKALDNSPISLEKIKKILIHQANEKMDEAIISRFYALYNKPMPEDIMPMSIHKLGNSSVATVPTLLDLVLKNKIEGYNIQSGDAIILASVGAGMNINAVVYQF